MSLTLPESISLPIIMIPAVFELCIKIFYEKITMLLELSLSHTPIYSTDHLPDAGLYIINTGLLYITPYIDDKKGACSSSACNIPINMQF
jgi:hypothetical protein